MCFPKSRFPLNQAKDIVSWRFRFSQGHESVLSSKSYSLCVYYSSSQEGDHLMAIQFKIKDDLLPCHFSHHFYSFLLLPMTWQPREGRTRKSGKVSSFTKNVRQPPSPFPGSDKKYFHVFRSFLAVQNSSIGDLVPWSVRPLVGHH